MSLKRILLSSSAAAALGLGNGAPAGAGEVAPLGALDIGIGGFAQWYALVGDLAEKARGGNGAYDLRTDTEVHVYARGADEATGLEYGGNIELQADTDGSGADEAFVFVRGAFGEFRWGDQDGVVESQKIAAPTLAAFSGGLDAVGPFDYPALVYGVYSDDATKVVYYSPEIAVFQLGSSFTPHVEDSGTGLGTTEDGGIDDLFESGISYTGEFGAVSVLASVTAAWGHFNQPAAGRSEDMRQAHAGIVLGFGNFKIGGGYGWEKGGRPQSTQLAGDTSYVGDSAFEAGARQQWYNLGVGATFGPTNLSVNWGQVLASEVPGGTPGSRDPEPYALVLSADVALAPGLVVGGEVAHFENRDGGRDNDGLLGLAGVRLAF